MSKFTEFGARKLHKLYKMAQKKRSHEEEVSCQAGSLCRYDPPRFANTKDPSATFPEGAEEEGRPLGKSKILQAGGLWFQSRLHWHSAVL